MEMGRFCWCIIILVWVQACMITGCSGCLEEEQNALFLLKASINYQNESFSPSSNLINKESTTDCCNWSSVECSNITGHVTHIFLSEFIDPYSRDWWSGSKYWYLNTSLFLPFQELKHLYLYSYFRVSKEGLERLSGLSKLEELYFDYIPFNNSFLPSLAKIATLKILSLFELRDWDYETANNTQGFERLSVLSKLEELNLDYNAFNESILPSLVKIASLKKLSLMENKFSGRVPINKGFERLSGLSKLEELYLDYNAFNESILPSLGKIASLKILSLESNKISGKVPINKGFKMSELEQLYLDGNNFTDMRFICKIASLKILYLREAKLDGAINIQELGKLKNLRELYLDYSTIDKSFLHKVGVMTSLNVLSMRTCGLNGSLPNQGEIPLELGNLSNIRALNLSHNNLIGSIPTTFSNLKEIESLDLSHNKLNGSIPSQLIELYSLAVFSVADNNLSGRTPERKAQFGTFDESSYKGNPFLYGPPLPNSENKTGFSSNHKGEESGGFIDMGFFYISFWVSYTIMLLGVVAAMYINPYWRQVCFSFIEVCLTKSFCFSVCDFS